jgi:hypothetical protein
MVENIKKTANPILHIPYYPADEFHIADFMSLEDCPAGWQLAPRPVLKEMVQLQTPR